MIPTYGSENPCSTLLGTAQIPFRVDPLSAWLKLRQLSLSCTGNADTKININNPARVFNTFRVQKVIGMFLNALLFRELLSIGDFGCKFRFVTLPLPQ